VSTEKQTDNNSFSVQEEIIKGKYPEAIIYSEAYTATKRGVRPVFEEVLGLLKQGDTLVIARLDRFARNTMEALTVIEELNNRGVVVHISNMGIIDNSPIGKLIFTVLSAFSSYEAEIIKERCMLGRVEARKKKGYVEGRPRVYTDAQLEHALELLDDYSYKQVAKMLGISVSTISRAKRRKQAQVSKTV